MNYTRRITFHLSGWHHLRPRLRKTKMGILLGPFSIYVSMTQCTGMHGNCNTIKTPKTPKRYLKTPIASVL